jgi:hypothetical protein
VLADNFVLAGLVAVRWAVARDKPIRPRVVPGNNLGGN